MFNYEIKKMKKFTTIAAMLSEITDDVDLTVITDTDDENVEKVSIDLKGGSIVWDVQADTIFVDSPDTPFDFKWNKE